MNFFRPGFPVAGSVVTGSSATGPLVTESRRMLLLAALIVLLAPVLTQAATERVGDFALLDATGSFHQLSRYQHRDAVVLLAVSLHCESSMQAASELAQRYGEHTANMQFLLLDIEGSPGSVSQSWNSPFPVLGDELRMIAESLNLSHAGEVLVFNPQRLSLYYRGSMASGLDATLTAIAAGEVRDTVTTAVTGCAIDYPALAAHRQSPPDYTTEIAPIIVENCSSCHRWGAAGPFAFDSYVSLLGWSPMVREVLLNKRMPPMQVDPATQTSANAHYIDPRDKQKLIHWMSIGAPRGDGEVDPLAEIPIEKIFSWQLGEPDYIVQVPRNVVPAVGILDYVYAETVLPFTEDKWVRAFQYSPGDERVLHHLMTFIEPAEGDFWGSEKDSLYATRRFLGSYIPGANAATEFAEGTAVRIPAGYKLAMQFHYVTNGLEVRDDTRIGLYFDDRSGQGSAGQESERQQSDVREIFTQAVSERFTIAPNDPDHAMHVTHRFDTPVVLTALRPRMNYRGKNVKFVLEHPDGTMETLLNVPAYNYGWQPQYFLDQPRQLAQGSKVHVIGAFDNSNSNPFNPDPRATVSWGLETKGEMFAGYLTFYDWK